MAFSDGFLKGIQMQRGLEDLAAAREEARTKELIKTATNNSMVPGAPTGIATEDGMNLNTGNAPRSFDPEMFGQQLERMGQPELALKWKDMYSEHKQKQEQFEVDDTLQAIDLATAGNKKAALKIAEKHFKGEEALTDIIVGADPKTKKPMISLVHKNGTRTTINDVDALKSAGVDSKTKYQTQEEFKKMKFLNTWDAPKFDAQKGVLAQTNPNTGQMNVLAKFDTALEKASKAEREAAEKLWDTYMKIPEVETFHAVRGRWDEARRSAKLNTSAGDVALTYQVVRGAFDPHGRTVTDADFMNAEKAKPILERMGLSTGQWDAVLSGQTYTPETRQKLLDIIHAVHESTKETVENTVNPQWEQRRDALGVKKELFNFDIIHKGDIKGIAERSWGSYEPEKYDYKMDTKTGKLMRKAK